MPSVVWPMPRLPDGRPAVVTSPYGDKRDGGTRLHKGVDILYRRLDGDDPILGSIPVGKPHGYKLFAVPIGIPALATEAGTVIRAGRAGPGRPDRFVALLHRESPVDHANSTVYVHLDDIYVDVGDRVRAGQPVGTVGPGPNSGRHLHLDRRSGASRQRKGVQIDPARYLASASHLDRPLWTVEQEGIVAVVLGVLSRIFGVGKRTS